MKPSIKIPIFNGSLDCQFQKYQIFDGKLEKFRKEGNDIKTDKERREMSDPHRFKLHRDFKKRLDEDEEADYGDIPDYVVRKHREFEENNRRKERRQSYGDRHENRDGDRDRRSFSRGDRKPYGGGGKRFEHNDNRGGFSRNRDDRKPFSRDRKGSERSGGRGDFRGKRDGGFRKGGNRKEGFDN